MPSTQAELAKVGGHPFSSLVGGSGWLTLECANGSGFSESAQRQLVEHIQTHTGFFIEIVNLNIRNRQYACAGDLRALDVLQRICDDMKKWAGPSQQRGTIDSAHLQRTLVRVTATGPHGEGEPVVGDMYAGNLPQQIQLKLGVATVPLVGVDVPFHSSLLRPRMNAFRRVLQESLNLGRVSPQRLVGKYIPNITGSPFAISPEYFESVYAITKSEALKDVLDNWEERAGQERERGATAEVC